MSVVNKSSVKPVHIPTSVELAKRKKVAQAANASSAKKKKKSSSRVYVAMGLVLVIIILLGVFFLMPKYKYSFNISGVDFVSNEYTPSEFFPQFKSNDSFLVVVDLRDGESNAWVVNAMQLWIVALNADNKRVQTLVRLSDSSGALKSCTTNDANIMSSREITQEQCNLLLNDSLKAKVIIGISKDNMAVMAQNKLEVFSSSASTVSQVNYYVIKQMYSDFDKTLALVNERINSIN